MVLRHCQVLSLGICVAYVKLPSVGIKGENIKLDWVKFISIVAFTWVLKLTVLAQPPGNDANMVNWRLDSLVAWSQWGRNAGVSLECCSDRVQRLREVWVLQMSILYTLYSATHLPLLLRRATCPSFTWAFRIILVRKNSSLSSGFPLQAGDRSGQWHWTSRFPWNNGTTE